MNKEITEKDKANYKKLAMGVVSAHPADLAITNAQAKMTLKALRDELPEGSSDELVITFMASFVYLASRIMSLPMEKAVTTLQSLFDHYTLAMASLMGVYDLDALADDEGAKSYEEAMTAMLRDQHEAADKPKGAEPVEGIVPINPRGSTMGYL